MIPSARLLDLSRLASRAALPLTGVDRVERAYLSALIADATPAFGLVRTPLGFLLLDKTGLAAFDQAITRQDFGRARLIDRLVRRKDPARACVEGFLRRHATARASHAGLARLLRRQNFGWYLNVGQTSLRAEVLDALPPACRVAVMIHDTIPLDHPDWQTPQAAHKLEKILDLTAAHADLVIATAKTTAQDISRHLAARGGKARMLTAHLGVTLAPPDPAALPAGIDLTQPYVLCLNTLEPRKNHAFLLDLWEEMGAVAPRLYLVGGTGWMVEGLQARLRQTTAPVTHLDGLSDGAVAALMEGARAVVNPSRAEGFGLPAFEALGRGLPLLCPPLPIWRELLGERPVYLGLDAGYLWQKTILTLAAAPPQDRTNVALLPTWEAHFIKLFAAL